MLQTKLDGEGVPEKFKGKSVADLVQAYAQLESKLGNQSAPPRPTGLQSHPLQIPQSGGSPFRPYLEEIGRNGKLSPQSRAWLLAPEGGGLDQETLDIFEAGAQSTAKVNSDALASIAGGPEAYGKVIEWAKSLPVGRQQAFNDALASPRPELRELAVKGLHAEFVAANGNPPAALVKPGGGSGGVRGFANLGEMTTAQRDPKYKTDQAYRDEVMSRAAAARAEGVEGFKS